jgi:1-acyl-sn-glycerol-3-phosphate acyltransferase
MAGVPIVPCVLLGTDRFYARKSWLPLRRTPIWIAFGDPVPYGAGLDKAAARARTEAQLTAAFQSLYTALREEFMLTPDDLPHPPRERVRKAS